MKISYRSSLLLAVLLVGTGAIWMFLNFEMQVAGHRPRLANQDVDSVHSTESEQPSDVRSDDARPESAPSPLCDSLPANTVCFPNGSKVQVRWRQPVVDYEFQPEPYAQHYDGLVTRANEGDTIAAMSLYEMLGNCQRAYVSETRLSEAIEILHQTHRFQTPNLAEPQLVAKPEKIPQFESSLTRDFERCKGLERDVIDNRDQWLELGSTGESTRARILYGSMLEDHKAALPYFESAWAMGDIEALPLMASVYRHQYNIGEAPGDNVKAYGVYLAYAQLLDAAMGPRSGHGQIAARQVARVQSSLANRASELKPHEIEEATKISIETLRDNTVCCFGL